MKLLSTLRPLSSRLVLSRLVLFTVRAIQRFATNLYQDGIRDGTMVMSGVVEVQRDVRTQAAPRDVLVAKVSLGGCSDV